MNHPISIVALIAVLFTALLVLLPKPTHRFHTKVTIDAPADQVWAVLTDTEKFPQWNPLVSHFAGTLAEGETLNVTVQNGTGGSMDFTPEVVVFKPGQELTWLGTLGMRGIFDGRHRFAVESLNAGTTRLVHEEDFAGILVPLFKGKLARETLPLFEAMNLALKSRVESSAPLARR